VGAGNGPWQEASRCRVRRMVMRATANFRPQHAAGAAESESFFGPNQRTVFRKEPRARIISPIRSVSCFRAKTLYNSENPPAASSSDPDKKRCMGLDEGPSAVPAGNISSRAPPPTFSALVSASPVFGLPIVDFRAEACPLQLACRLIDAPSCISATIPRRSPFFGSSGPPPHDRS